MPPSGRLSHISMSRSIAWARIVGITCLVVSLVATLLVIALWPSPHRQVPYESTGPGVVRFYNQEKRMLIHESDGGYVKMMEVCGVVAAWEKMHANIKFHWSYTTVNNTDVGCYQIDSIQRLGQTTKESSK